MDANAVSCRQPEYSLHAQFDQELLNQFTEQHSPGLGDLTLTPDVVSAICKSCLICTEVASVLIRSLSSRMMLFLRATMKIMGCQFSLLSHLLSFGKNRGQI